MNKQTKKSRRIEKQRYRDTIDRLRDAYERDPKVIEKRWNDRVFGGR